LTISPIRLEKDIFQDPDDLMFGFLDLVPGGVTGRGADHHPGQQQFTDLMEGHKTDTSFSRRLIMVMEHFSQGQGGGALAKESPILA